MCWEEFSYFSSSGYGSGSNRIRLQADTGTPPNISRDTRLNPRTAMTTGRMGTAMVMVTTPAKYTLTTGLEAGYGPPVIIPAIDIAAESHGLY